MPLLQLEPNDLFVTARRKEVNMARSRVTIAVVFALSLVLSSCRPVDVVVGGREIDTVLATESIVARDAIPPTYGRLVGVIQSPRNDEMAILWFEKPDSTIAAVWVHYMQGVGQEALVIPRK